MQSRNKSEDFCEELWETDAFDTSLTGVGKRKKSLENEMIEGAAVEGVDRTSGPPPSN